MTLKDFFEKLANGAVWSAGVSFERANPLPLDKYSVFASLEEAQAYVKENPVAYPGQVVAVVADGASAVYYINDKMQLTEVGPKTEVDGKTIQLVDGVLSLKVGYDGDVAEAGSQLVLQADGSLKWVKPDTTTVEGLSASVESLTTRATSLEKIVNHNEQNTGLVDKASALETAVNDEVSGLANAHAKADKNARDIVTANGKIAALENDNITNKASITALGEKDAALDGEIAALKIADTTLQENINQKADKATTLKGYGITDAFTKEQTNSAIASAVADASHLKRVIVNSADELPTIESADENTIYMVPRVAVVAAEEKSDSYVEYMVVNNKWEIIGDTVVDLTDYVKTSEVDNKLKAYAKTTEVDTKLEDYTNTVALTGLLKNKVDVHGSDRLMTEAEGIKLGTVAENAQVNVVDKVSTDFVIGEGKELQLSAGNISAIANVANKVDKADGMGLTHNDLTNELKAQYDKAEENYVKSVAAEELAVSEKGELSVVAIANNKVTGLAGLLEGKVDVEKGKGLSTNDYTTVEKQKLAGITEGAEVNFIKSTSDEFTSIDGNLVVNAIAQSKITGLEDSLLVKLDKAELSNEITKARESNDALLSTTDRSKLNAIASGAQVNKLEGVRVNGQALQIAEDKTVNLPIAAVNLGLVKSSADENAIKVDVDGTMKVNKIDVANLVQTQDIELILNGGSATK